MTAVAGLLCCPCPSTECECDLTSLSVTWTGSLSFGTICGVPYAYDPNNPPAPGSVPVWDGVYQIPMANKTAVQTVFGEQTVCDGFGIKLAAQNAPSFQGPCPPVPDFPPETIVQITPTSARVRFVGPQAIPGGWQVQVNFVTPNLAPLTDAEMDWYESGQVGPPPNGVVLMFKRLVAGGNCPMVGTYAFDPDTSSVPGNPGAYPSLALGYAPSYDWSGFAAGSVTVS
jgi:hypothetical protein